MATLTEDEKARLRIVLAVAGDDENKIRDGIIRALQGVNERGTRGYLWHLLERRALAKIHHAKKKNPRQKTIFS